MTTTKTAHTSNPDDYAANLLIGKRVAITAPDDFSDVMHLGTAVSATANGEWIGVRVDGENLTHEWPTGRVFHAPGQ